MPPRPRSAIGLCRQPTAGTAGNSTITAQGDAATGNSGQTVDTRARQSPRWHHPGKTPKKARLAGHLAIENRGYQSWRPRLPVCEEVGDLLRRAGFGGNACDVHLLSSSGPQPAAMPSIAAAISSSPPKVIESYRMPRRLLLIMKRLPSCTHLRRITPCCRRSERSRPGRRMMARRSAAQRPPVSS